MTSSGAGYSRSVQLKNSGLECLCDGRRECLHHPIGERCSDQTDLNVSPYFCQTCYSCRASFVVWNLNQVDIKIPDTVPAEWREELQS